MYGQSRKPLVEVFDEFVVSQTAQGLSEITLSNYRRHLHSISNHLDIQKPMDTFDDFSPLAQLNPQKDKIRRSK